MTERANLPFSERLSELRKPLPGAWLRWTRGRVQKREGAAPRAQLLPIVHPAHLADWLDQIMGPDRWSVEYRPAATGVICRLGLRDDQGTWIYKEYNDAGSAAARPAAGGREAENPVSLADAFLRAAMLWGIARYLWTYNAPWIELVNGKVPRGTKIPFPNEMLPEPERTEGPTKPMPYFVEEPVVLPVGSNGSTTSRAPAPVGAPSTASNNRPPAPAPAPAATATPPAQPPASRPERPAQSADPWDNIELPGVDKSTLQLEPYVRSKVISIVTSIKCSPLKGEVKKSYINRPEHAIIPLQVREALIKLVDMHEAARATG